MRKKWTIVAIIGFLVFIVGLLFEIVVFIYVGAYLLGYSTAKYNKE
jgi:hypothetical protein